MTEISIGTTELGDAITPLDYIEKTLNEIAGIDFLFLFKNCATSSPAKCCESAADPPLPQKIILFPDFNEFKM